MTIDSLDDVIFCVHASLQNLFYNNYDNADFTLQLMNIVKKSHDIEQYDVAHTDTQLLIKQTPCHIDTHFNVFMLAVIFS